MGGDAGGGGAGGCCCFLERKRAARSASRSTGGPDMAMAVRLDQSDSEKGDCPGSSVGVSLCNVDVDVDSCME